MGENGQYEISPFSDIEFQEQTVRLRPTYTMEEGKVEETYDGLTSKSSARTTRTFWHRSSCQYSKTKPVQSIAAILLFRASLMKAVIDMPALCASMAISLCVSGEMRTLIVRMAFAVLHCQPCSLQYSCQCLFQSLHAAHRYCCLHTV